MFCLNIFWDLVTSYLLTSLSSSGLSLLHIWLYWFPGLFLLMSSRGIFLVLTNCHFWSPLSYGFSLFWFFYFLLLYLLVFLSSAFFWTFISFDFFRSAYLLVNALSFGEIFCCLVSFSFGFFWKIGMTFTACISFGMSNFEFFWLSMCLKLCLIVWMLFDCWP